MSAKHKTDVLVVGAGPVGLFSAIQLEDRGLKVAIIDEGWRTAGHSYALALHPATLELLSTYGLAADVLERALRIERVALYDARERKAALDLSQLPGNYPFLAVLPQSDFESLLEQRLEERRVKVLWKHRLAEFRAEDGGVAATVHQLAKVSSGYAVARAEWTIDRVHRYSSSFLIGADGHRSLVRRSLGIESTTIGEPEYFAVFEFQCASGQLDEVRVLLDEGTTNVFWPLPDGRCRVSFQISPEEAEGARREKSRLTVQIGQMEFPYLSQETLERLLRERAPWFDLGVGEIGWSLVVRFEHSLASRFGEERSWLCGDAAHLTGPVGGQSMNVGMREARDLATCVAAILREGAPAERLAGYASERREEWQQLHGLEGKGLEGGEACDPWVAGHSGALLSCIPASGEHLRLLASQIGLFLP